jgi:hypothetical protein
MTFEVPFSYSPDQGRYLAEESPHNFGVIDEPRVSMKQTRPRDLHILQTRLCVTLHLQVAELIYLMDTIMR